MQAGVTDAICDGTLFILLNYSKQQVSYPSLQMIFQQEKKITELISGRKKK